MQEKKLLVIRGLVFMGMIACFALQSMSSFKKWVRGHSSITEGIVKAPLEPLPSFSVCSDPPFDAEIMQNGLNISSTLFLPSFAIELVANPSAFPVNLSEDFNATNSLNGLWMQSVVAPSVIYLAGTADEPDVIADDYFDPVNENVYTEVKDYNVMYSYWYGKCSSLTLKKSRQANEILVLGFRAPKEYQGKDVRLNMVLHESPGSRYGLVPGDFLHTKPIAFLYGQITMLGINRKVKLMDVQKSHEACKEYSPVESQALCKIQKKYLNKLINQTQESIQYCADNGRNVTRLCMIPQWYNIWSLSNDLELMDQCTDKEEYLCMTRLMDLQMENKVDEDCQDPCKKVMFDTETKSIVLPKSYSNLAFVYMYYQSYEMSEMREYLIFDFSSIVAAIGGSLGLFLGFSFFQCGSMLLGFIRRLFEAATIRPFGPQQSVQQPDLVSVSIDCPIYVLSNANLEPNENHDQNNNEESETSFGS